MDSGKNSHSDFALSASAVSYILAKRNGIDVGEYAFSNLSSFSELEPKDIRNELSFIRSVSDDMIKEMDLSLNPPHKSQSKSSPSR